LAIGQHLIIKTFFLCLKSLDKYASVFVPGKPSPPSLMAGLKANLEVVSNIRLGLKGLPGTNGAMALGIVTLSIMTLSIMTLSTKTLSTMTLSTITLSTMTLSIMILSIITLNIMALGIMTLCIMTLSLMKLS
jgi:hypothetical protein